MSRVFLNASVGAFLLAGCAHGPQLAGTPSIPQHYIAKPAVKIAPKPVVTVAPAPPSPKQTFKQRWLRKFFRERAL